jgi:hypothetical protein
MNNNKVKNSLPHIIVDSKKIVRFTVIQIK